MILKIRVRQTGESSSGFLQLCSTAAETEFILELSKFQLDLNTTKLRKLSKLLWNYQNWCHSAINCISIRVEWNTPEEASSSLQVNLYSCTHTYRCGYIHVSAHIHTQAVAPLWWNFMPSMSVLGPPSKHLLVVRAWTLTDLKMKAGYGVKTNWRGSPVENSIYEDYRWLTHTLSVHCSRSAFCLCEVSNPRKIAAVSNIDGRM